MRYYHNVNQIVTVRDLIEKLQSFPPDMGVICTRCSDLMPLELDGIAVVKAVRRQEWIEWYHPTMSAQDQADVREYVHFDGN